MADLPAPMSPGAYLRRRREAAGLTRRQAAAAWAMFRASPEAPAATLVADQSAFLARVEDEQDNLTVAQATLLRTVFPLDPETYQLLLFHHHAAGQGLGVPRLCQRCAGSWSDATWSETNPALCTACAATTFPDAPASEGIEA